MILPELACQPLIIGLLAVPILIQVYFSAGLAYRCLGSPSAGDLVAAPVVGAMLVALYMQTTSQRTECDGAKRHITICQRIEDIAEAYRLFEFLA